MNKNTLIYLSKQSLSINLIYLLISAVNSVAIAAPNEWPVIEIVAF